ncbi:MAG: MFS transporter [Chloroflexi bacterium]|nr:MFS transporter [Chloroflexota bacterium]
MKRSPLLVVYVTVFIDLLGFGIILPALPYYATAFGATGVWVGALLTAYSAAQFLSAPVLGRLSDRVGRRPIILLSLAGSAVSLLVTGLATNLPVLLAARTLAGLFGGSISAAQAYIADVTAPTDRARAMGLLGAAIGLGFVLGPALGALLSPAGFGTAAFVAAGLAAANLVFGLVALTESRPAERRTATRARSTWANFLDALRHPSVSRILAGIFLTTLAFVSMETTFALLGQQRFGLDTRGFGLVLTYVGIIAVIVQGGLVGRLARRYGERALAVAGAGAIGAGLAALAIAPSLPTALVALTGLAVGHGLATPTLPTLLSRESDVDEQGGALGLGQSVAAAARAIGPLLAGWLFDIQALLPYLGGALLGLAVAILLTGVRQPANAPAIETERSR